jgi:membrane protease YdiL (CAAX protease family)
MQPASCMSGESGTLGKVESMAPTILPQWKALLSCWDARLLTFLLAVVVPVNGYVRFWRMSGRTGPAMPVRKKLIFYSRVILFQWLLVAAMLLVAFRHGLSLAAVGERLGDARLTLGATLGLLAIMAVVSVFVRWRVRRASPETLAAALGRMGKLAPAFGVEMAAFALLCVTAGVCEELLYRGWLVNVLWAASGSVWVAVVAGAAIFGIGHAYQGLKGILRTAFVGLQLAVLFVFVGNLIPGQVLHAAVDLLAGYAGAVALKRAACLQIGL